MAYQYKPYTPKKSGFSSIKSPGLSDTEQAIKALSSQKDSLEKRLAAVGGDTDNRNFLEKALNLKQDQGFLMDLVEVINRPVETVKQGILAADQGENVLKGAWEGLSGKEVTPGSEFLEELGVLDEPETKVGKFIADVGVDILLDPLTYIPVGGWILKGVKGAVGTTSKVTVRAAKELGERAVSEIIQEAGEGATKEVIERVAKEKGFVYYFSDDFAERTKEWARFDDEYFDAAQKGGIKVGKKNDRVFRRNNPVGKTKKGEWQFKKGAEMETRVTDAVADYLDELPPEVSDNILVVQGKAAQTETDIIARGDIELFYKLDDGSAVRIAKMEVKDFIGGKSAMLPGSTVQLADDGSLSIITESLSEGTKTKLLEGMDALKRTKIKGKGGDETIGQMIRKILDPTQTSPKSVSFTIPELNELNQAFGEIFTGSYEYISVVQDGVLKVFKTSDMLDSMTFKGFFQRGSITKKTGYFRNQFSANVDELTDITDEWFTQTIGSMDIQRTEGYVTKMLAAVSKKVPEPVRQAFIPVKDFFEKIGFAFDATKGFTDDLISRLNRVGGRSFSRLQGYSKRLAKMTDNLVKSTGDPTALKKVTEIIESGAKLGDNGVVKLTREYSAKEIMDNVYANIADGEAYTLLPRFAKDIDTDNFIKSLNDVYKRAGNTQDAFELVKRGDDWALTITDDVAVKDVKKALDNLLPNDAAIKLSFGKMEMSDELIDFWKANADSVAAFQGLQDEVVKLLQREIGFTNLPDFLKGRMGYMRHVLSEDAASALAKMRPVTRAKYVNEGTNLLKSRKFLGTADEINQGLKSFYDIGVDVFDTQVQAGLEDLIHVATRSMEQHEVLDVLLRSSDKQGRSLFTVIDNTKASAEQLGNQFKILEGSFDKEFSKMFKNLTPKTQDALSKYFANLGFEKGNKIIGMHRSAYNMLNRINRSFVEIPEFVKNYDKFMNGWKSITLVSPGFHLRNFFGNITNSYLVGMGPIAQSRYSAKAMLDFKRYKEVAEALASGGSLDDISDIARKSYESVMDFVESGVAQTHKGVRDLDTVKEMLEKGQRTFGGRIVQANFDIAEKMDDFQRYVLYQWSLDDALSKYGKMGPRDALIKARADASRKVTDALFDYSHLTGFEKEYMKRLFPFYTFMKNNLVFQAKNMFTDNLKQYARLTRAYKYAVSDFGGLDVEDMPDYMTENMWMPMPIKVSKNDKEAISFLKLNLPLSDFTELVENPFKKGVASITAPVKLMFELGTGKDIFTGAPLSDFPGQTSRADSGIFPQIRDERGTFALSSDPIMQKIANDMGLRVPKNYASIVFDLLDTATGKQSVTEGVGDITSRLGITGIQEEEKLDITALYQELEQLRNLRSLYEQEEGQKLPTLKELGLD